MSVSVPDPAVTVRVAVPSAVQDRSAAAVVCQSPSGRLVAAGTVAGVATTSLPEVAHPIAMAAWFATAVTLTVTGPLSSRVHPKAWSTPSGRPPGAAVHAPPLVGVTDATSAGSVTAKTAPGDPVGVVVGATGDRHRRRGGSGHRQRDGARRPRERCHGRGSHRGLSGARGGGGCDGERVGHVDIADPRGRVEPGDLHLGVIGDVDCEGVVAGPSGTEAGRHDRVAACGEPGIGETRVAGGGAAVVVGVEPGDGARVAAGQQDQIGVERLGVGVRVGEIDRDRRRRVEAERVPPRVIRAAGRGPCNGEQSCKAASAATVPDAVVTP